MGLGRNGYKIHSGNRILKYANWGTCECKMTPTGPMVVSSTKTDKHRTGMPTDVTGKISLCSVVVVNSDQCNYVQTQLSTTRCEPLRAVNHHLSYVRHLPSFSTRFAGFQSRPITITLHWRTEGHQHWVFTHSQHWLKLWKMNRFLSLSLLVRKRIWKGKVTIFKQILYWYSHQRKLQAARMGMWNWRCLPHRSRHPGHRIT